MTKCNLKLDIGIIFKLSIVEIVFGDLIHF